MCIHDMISSTTTRNPDDQAINSWDGQLTYSQLDKLSSRLAVYLVSLNIGPEIIVSLCFEKSMWTVVAMLGVLKSGGAFVLLDPAHTMNRFGIIIAEVKASLVIVSSDVAVDLGNIDRQVSLLVLDHQAMKTLDFCLPLGIEPKAVSPANLAYIIWTSGSSGKPKATMIEHRSFSSSAASQIDAFQMKPGVRIFQATSYSFDVCLTEILVTLIAGGVVCIPSSSSRLNDPTSSIAILGAEWMFTSPSFARTLQPESVKGIKRLILGGEAVRQSDIHTWADRLDLTQAYGPSECSVFSVTNAHLESSATASNIGKAIGCRVWITQVSDPKRLAPIGASGELLIEGPIVGRGYLGDEIATMTSFIDDPHWFQSYGIGDVDRLYRTGDIVRYDWDGSIHYVGRADAQVKVNARKFAKAPPHSVPSDRRWAGHFHTDKYLGNFESSSPASWSANPAV
ncbi:hypothetical protein BGZ57DRAFT_992597 [Hyaloscypha finlandica]|nr:hypothetical protein BGZ57DRAFT_992597 [Hyaloscypha finlandica]